jgi:hypothetical protein
VTYLDYIVFFEKRDHVQAFSGNATRLYLKLLHLANLAGWPAEFAKPDPYVAAVCGFSENTMKDCRTKLVASGLLATTPGKMGRGAVTVYRLLAADNGNNKVSNSDTLPVKKVSNSDTLTPSKVSNSDTLPVKKSDKVSDKVSNSDTLNIDKEKESSSAASAATSSTSLSGKKATTKKPSSKGASHEEIAALPLPFNGADFAEAWHTFYATNTKQAGKNLSAFGLMLKKLGKYPEGFAVLMLERAIMSNWQGVEHGGTPRDFAEWQAQQARQPPQPLPTTGQPVSLTLDLNEEFEAQQRARDQAEADERARLFRTTYVK